MAKASQSVLLPACNTFQSVLLPLLQIALQGVLCSFYCTENGLELPQIFLSSWIREAQRQPCSGFDGLLCEGDACRDVKRAVKQVWWRYK